MKANMIRKNALIHLILLLGVGITIFPFAWMILTSFKEIGEALQVPPTILPKSLNWRAYTSTFQSLPFAKIYFNTITVTLATILGQMVFCSMAAYGFGRMDFPGKRFLFIMVLSVLMVPGQIFLIPQYLIVQKMGLLDSMPALVLPHLFSAFSTFMLRQFFMALPKELEEAAILDGCNHFQVYRRIMLPLVKPGLVALVIFTGKSAWNNFMWPLIVNTSPKKMILAPALSTLQGEYLTDYPAQMAGSVMAVIPVIVLFFIFQKQFIEGVAHTGVKG